MRRAGSALVATLVALLVLDIIALGTLAALGSELGAFTWRARLLQARIAAESAIRTTIADWDSTGAETLLPFQRITLATGPDSASVTVEALGAGRYLLAGTASPSARTLALARINALPRDELHGLFEAALHTGADLFVGPAARIDGTPDSPVCADPMGTEVAPGIAAPASATIEISPGSTVDGAPPSALHPGTTDSPRIAGIALLELRPLADLLVDGAISLEDEPACCDGHARFLFADGDLHIAGGDGDLFLLVSGALRIADGVRIRGAILAGRVSIGAAEVVGAVRAFGSQPSDVNGTIRFDRCAIERAVRAPALRRPFRLGPRLWLPSP